MGSYKKSPSHINKDHEIYYLLDQVVIVIRQGLGCSSHKLSFMPVIMEKNCC
jgi:hypothetical protein